MPCLVSFNSLISFVSSSISAAKSLGGSGIDSVFDLVNAIQVLSETGGTLTSDGTVQDVYINNAPLGVYTPKAILIDLDNMVGGDTVVVQVLYRIKSGGNLLLLDTQSYTGADGGLPDSQKLICISLLPNRFGVQVTLQRTAGADHNYDWEAIWEA